jgi:hypothetical protein
LKQREERPFYIEVKIEVYCCIEMNLKISPAGKIIYFFVLTPNPALGLK